MTPTNDLVNKGDCMKKPFKKKDPFSALPESFKDAVGSMGLEELKSKTLEVAKSELENQAAAKADEDLAQKRAQAMLAGRGYIEQTKLNKTKLKFLIQAMADKGDMKSLDIIKLELSAVKS